MITEELAIKYLLAQAILKPHQILFAVFPSAEQAQAALQVAYYARGDAVVESKTKHDLVFSNGSHLIFKPYSQMLLKGWTVNGIGIHSDFELSVDLLEQVLSSVTSRQVVFGFK